MYGPPQDCKGKVWARRQVCGNVWSAAGLQGKGLGEKTSLRQCMVRRRTARERFGREDKSAAMYGPPQDCKGKVWARRQVCGNVWSAAGLQGKGLGEKTSLRQCMVRRRTARERFGREDKSAAMYGPPQDCKGKVWARRQVCGNVWSAAGLQGKGLGEKTSLRQCMVRRRTARERFGREDKSAAMYGPPQDCKGKVWARRQVCGNVWSAAGLQGKGLGEKTSLRQCMVRRRTARERFGREDKSAAMYGPPQDCKGKVWARRQVCGNVWSAAGLQGKGLGEKTSLRQCMVRRRTARERFGREDKSAAMYSAFGWRS